MKKCECIEGSCMWGKDAALNGYICAMKLPPFTVASVPDRLKRLGALFEDRNKTYGAAYKYFGKTLAGMFPNGLTLKTEEDFNRFAIFVLAAGKFCRYARAFDKGGHPDSLNDTSVYMQMLAEYDEEVLNGNPRP